MKTIIEILIDNSNSMGFPKILENPEQFLLPDGKTRMSLAKRIIKNELLPLLEYSAKIFVRKFHSLDYENESSELVIDTIYKTELNLEVLKEKIDEIIDPEDTGGTPITDAIKYSINELRQYSDWDRKIILVTDGQETGKGNYRKAAKEAMNLHGIRCNIFIIGIQQSDEAKSKAKELAKETGGSYMNLKTTKYDEETIRSKLRPLKRKILNQSVENRVNPTGVADSTFQTVSLSNRAGDKEESIANQDSASTIKPELITNNPEVEKGKINQEIEITLDEKNNKNSQQLALIENTVKNNSEVLGLLNKQMKSIQDELVDMKKSNNDFFGGSDVIITENKEFNERVGRISEEYVFNYLETIYGDKVIWLNEKGESGVNHDFEIIEQDEEVIKLFIECKGTSYSEKRFFLTKKEWDLFLSSTTSYQIYFIFNALVNPQLIIIENLLDWILCKKVVPYSSNNIKLKRDRIIFTIMEENAENKR